jgi:hypothetical protein
MFFNANPVLQWSASGLTCWHGIKISTCLPNGSVTVVQLAHECRCLDTQKHAFGSLLCCCSVAGSAPRAGELVSHCCAASTAVQDCTALAVQ